MLIKKQKTILIPKIKSYFNHNLKGKTIALWGLAFKPETDDIREAPSLDIINILLEEGCKIQCYDPEAMENVKSKYKDKLTFATSMYNALTNADALVICTEWSIFRTPNFNKIGEHLANNVIFDGRNLYNINDVEKEGFTYFSIGRKNVSQYIVENS